MTAKLKANKLLALLLCLVMVVGLLPTMALADETVYNVGDEVTISFTIQDNPGFHATAVEIMGDWDALQLLEINEGSLLIDAGASFVANKNVHQVVFCSPEEEGKITGDGVLFTAKFRITEKAVAGKTYNLTAERYYAETVTINGGSIKVAEAPAETETGSLMISKTVTGEGADASQEFEFTVTLLDGDGAGVSGTFGNDTFTNGTATVKLKGGESATISDIPAGYTYTVTEAAVDHYTATSTGATGTIAANETAKAEFTNTYSAPVEVETCSLTISKTVSGGVGTTRDFPFEMRVYSSDEVLCGQHGDLALSNDGDGIFDLAAGQSITITGLPVGTSFRVQEIENDDCTVTYRVNGGDYENGSIATGTIETDTVIEFNNYKPGDPPGSVTIQKSVTGDLAPEENGEAVDYSFNLKLLDEDGNAVVREVFCQKSGGYWKERQEISTTGFEFSLQKEESITFTEIPAGTKVKIEEISTGDFTTSIFDGTETIRNTNSYLYTIEGNKTGSIQFDNNYGDKTGSLTVSKTVSGNGASTTKAFTFNVWVSNSDSPLEGTYGDMVFDEDGKATFTLTDGQSVKATGLPAGYVYYVEETDADGYTVTARVNGEPYDIGEEAGVEGTIESDNLDVVVAFDNYKASGGTVIPTPDPEYGSVKITKTVKGDKAPTDGIAYEFTAWVKTSGGTAVSESVSYQKTAADGTTSNGSVTIGKEGYTFTLKDGESIVFSNITSGRHVEVKEITTGDFTTTSSGLTNGVCVISTNSTKTVAFVNDYGNADTPEPTTPTTPEPTTSDRPLDDVPKTGDESGMGLWIALALVSLIGMVTLSVGRKRFIAHRSR